MLLKRKFRICILGSGFAGVTVLIHLKKLLKNNKDIEIILISKGKHFLFTPLLHEVATGEVEAEHITYSIKKLQNELSNFDYIQESILKINLNKQVITTENGIFHYDYLVIGLGNITNFYGNDSIKFHSHTLKSLDDALKIKKQLHLNLEKANRESDLRKKEVLTNFVVVGGGATGVELTGGICDFINMKLNSLDNVKNEDIKIFLIELSDRLLNELNDPKSSEIAKKRFEELGVNVFLNREAMDFNGKQVKVYDLISKKEFDIDAGMFIWTAGVKPGKVIEKLDVKKDENERIITDKYLSLIDYPNVYAIGDNASVEGEEYPTTAQVAVQQAKIVAYNLYSKTTLFSYSKPFKYFHQGTLITIGKNYAISDIFGVKIKGTVGWFIWKLIHFAKLMGIQNRFNIFIDWLKKLTLKNYDSDNISELLSKNESG